ncbi:MAG: hypothetical protein A2428_10120 [Bdellovibrionales bacterium RIFOXYC1_FULL_54_43]|nr:MAG: hypothetical protein A2428_10120 [Bdellovibrionales bacterium RIFOXYC1_FULL_54_43]OFZ80539.1 MAG: hypothetical protein A2603_13215 [Bdellovibrionales bacterium RIFOXYD1_FULL_55_31]
MLLNQLGQFYEVARLRSFSKAAIKLRVNQSGLSKTVKKLEEEVGGLLLDRTRGGRVEITPMGREVLQHCERIFGEIDEIRAVTSRKDGELTGALRLAISDNLANYVMPDLLKPILKRHPRLTLQIFTGTASAIQQELLSGSAEIGMFYTSIQNPALKPEKLADVEFALVAKKPLRLEGLSSERYIGSRLVDYGTPYPALQMLRSLNIAPAEVLEANNQEVQKRLAIRGYGYTLLPHFMAREDIARGRLVRVRTRVQLISPLYFAVKKNRTLSRPAELFIAHLRAESGKFLKV